jgi:glycosyltransferase involved in cell wall biosynthesis
VNELALISALITLMWASFFAVFLFYACYSAVLLFFYRRSGRMRDGRAEIEFFYPKVSLIVPVYNEEKTVAKKVQNIKELDYPSDRTEVLFVDGCSTDKTPREIENQARDCEKPVRVIRQGRREGYTRGMMKGIAESTGDIIVATDAGAYHSPDAIKHLAKHFKNPLVGAVTGKEIVLSHGKGSGPRLEKSYRFFYDLMRSAETQMSSTPDTKGEILAVRRDVCGNVSKKLELSPDASFDSCVPYEAKSMGYTTIYDGEATYYEYAPSSFMDRMRQQVRRATSLIGALLMYKVMLLKKRYDKFGLVIMPAHFVMNCLLPWLFLAGVGCLLALTLLGPMSTVPFWTIALGAVLVSDKSRVFLVSFVQSQVALATATLRLAARRESMLIETIPSTR